MTGAEPHRRHALVIDDEDGVRHLVCELLGLLGFETDGAASGPEGLAAFERSAYDLVVTDLMMPKMTGWQVAESVRRHTPAVGLIMATASVSNLDPTRARELALTFLPKPFQLRELREAVEAALKTAAEVRVTDTIQSPREHDRLVAEASMPASDDAPSALVGTLRAAAGTVRRAAADLEGLVGAAEALAQARDEARAREAELGREMRELREAQAALVREYESAVAALNRLEAEHEALRRDRDATARALGDARAQYDALVRERHATAETIEAILLRLRH